jgi:hypothetical protein
MNRAVLTAAAAGFALVVGAPRDAEAAYIATMQQVGSDVVVNGSGSINLGGLRPLGGPVNYNLIGNIAPNRGRTAIGPTGSVSMQQYYDLSGSGAPFGTGGANFATSGSADFVLLDLPPLGPPPSLTFVNLLLPGGYISGAQLNSSMTFANKTYLDLGVNVGSYVWSWAAARPPTPTR